ncbi:hypothetical protein COCNU_08G002060 [Cocos nucifera]|uniref:Uncharacterized protein n=1 Tax=Cocos nucifera TaxID=13894 RepID=A0A8K0IHF4_COCNU|nr:hypothetical protein COCNU_08G002060 [Cocos nucifera]
MKGNAGAIVPPPQQKMERKQSLEQEHRLALETAVTLNIPHAVPPTEQPSDDTNPAPSENQDEAASHSKQDEATSHGSSKSSRTNWDELVEKLFTRNASGGLVLKKDISINDQR